jgi:hypothetical protein
MAFALSDPAALHKVRSAGRSGQSHFGLLPGYQNRQAYVVQQNVCFTATETRFHELSLMPAAEP